MIKSLLLGFLLFFSGCGSGGSSMPENIFPTANMTVNKTSLNAGEVLSLDASSSIDSDGTIESYEWLIQDNQRLGTQKKATWTAPSSTQEQVYKITLIVIDDDGAQDSISLDVVVNAQVSNAPVAKIVASSNSVFVGDTVSLDAGTSTDSDGNITSFAWSDNLGNAETATWTAPATAGEYTLSVTVVDDSGMRDTETIVITVSDRVNQAPIARISGNAPYAALGETITLSGETSTDDEAISTYAWSSETVPDLGSGTSITWTAPATIGSYDITLHVSDAQGLEDNTTLTINVINPASSIAEIQGMIEDSNTSALSDVTYICVGDSTRVESVRDKSHLLFQQIETSLAEYNVTSHLLARGSHRLEQFNNPDLGFFPTYNDVISFIPGSGSTTIMDLSLGINDLLKFDTDITAAMIPGIRADIIAQLKEAIYHIKTAKPDTMILLTSPNPLYSWDQGTDAYMNAYRTVSSEWSMAFVNFHDEVFVDYNATDRAAMYRGLDETPPDEIHYSPLGLSTMADYILAYILPNSGS